MKIKQGKEENYQKYVDINKPDEYSKACVDCGEIFGNFVDEGKTFDEAEELMLATPDGQELTGFMMGALMSGVSNFHERGDEIKAWWNNKTNGDPDHHGVKNPAIITI